MAAERATGSALTNSGTGLAHRLVRSLSGRASSLPAAQPISPVLSSGTMPPSMSEVEGASTSTSPTQSTPAAAKKKGLFAGLIDRFKDLGVALGLSTTTSEHLMSSPTNVATVVPTLPLEARAGESSGQPEAREPETGPDTEPPEPTYLAQKIQSLIDALPLPTSPRNPAPKRPKSPARDRTGKPIPPPGATPIKDSNLIAMLSSATIMNGGRVGERERRISVWSVLDTLRSPRQDDGNDVEEGGSGSEGGGDRTDDDGSVFQDTSGIMMYSPLMPTSDSLVEIAESGIVTPQPIEEGGSSSEAAQLAGLMGMWPFSVWGGSAGPTSAAGPVNPTSGSPSPVTSLRSLPMSPPGSPRSAQFRVQAQRIWVPSTTKLSLQAMWWGYRIYLPPPVLDILDDKQLEASKRAALITTALTWFFSNIPLTSLPPPVRPALLLMQTLIPYIGYIGTFISWSWSTIRSYDTGLGVILTATWLLPIALLPGSWDADDFPPASPPQQVPTPLPPNSDPPKSPPPTSPSPVPPPSTPPSSSPVPPSPVVPSAPPTSPRIPVELPPEASPQPPSAPASPGSNTQFSQLLSPISLRSPVLQLSEPLPSWVPPPPPPSPPKIPLPDIEEDHPGSPSPRFSFGILQKGKSKDKDKNRERERKKEKTKMRLKAMVSSPFSSSSKKGLDPL